MRLTWPLTGRSEELRSIEASVESPDLAGIVVCGAAGVGKSRIVRDALASLGTKGYDTRWAVASSSARSMPLGAFAPWVESAVADDSQLVQLVRGVIDALTAAPDGRVVVVAVDDVQLLDDLSTFVLHQIVQRGAAKVLLTVRDGEPIPVAVQEIWNGGSLARLDLQPLSRDETTALLSAALGGPIDPAAAQRLWSLTRGNALYLRNIVEQEVADARLAHQHGYWRWTGDPVVPPGLVDLIESRMGSLPEAVLDVVDALAVGEPLDIATLSNIADRSAVEDADLRGLIAISSADERVEARLAHPLYGEVRRNRVAVTRMRRLRGAVAMELATAEGDDDIRLLVRRAALTVNSDLTPDPEFLTRAADGAMWLADAQLAERLADAAIRAGAGTGAYYIGSFALSWQGRGAEADAVLADIPTGGFSDADHVTLAGFRASNALWGLGDPDLAKRLIDDADGIATPLTRPWIDALLTLYWAAMARPDKARACADGFSLDQLPSYMGPAAAWALVVAHGDSGRTTEALATADGGYAHVERTAGAMHMRLLIVDKHVGALWQAGRLDEASSVAVRAREQVADLPGVARLLGAATAGRAALGAGLLHEACALLEPTVDLFRGDANGFRYRYLIPLTTALAMRGMSDGAAAALQDIEGEYHRSWRFVDYERDIAQAWVSAAQGAVTEAVSISLSAGEKSRENGQFAAEVLCLQTAAQFGDGSGARRLRELEAVVEGPRAGMAARFAAALADGNGAELEAVSEGFERMGDLVAAVDAAAHAAVAYRREERKGSALTCSARAEELASHCGGARTPALLKAAQPVPLTDREREIVMLIGRGLSSPAIAERLTLSVRTVEGHIYRAMAKSGAADREELARMLPRRLPDT